MSSENVSEKRILAARANGALSRGPKTPEGKARSSRNAIRHGLLSKIVVLSHEDPELFGQLFENYAARFNPADEIEMGLVEEMVAANWRARRALAIERRTTETEMNNRPPGPGIDRLADSFGDLSTTPKLGVLHRYQARLHLMHSRALRDFLLLRRTLPCPGAPLDTATEPPNSDSPVGEPPVPNEPLPNEPNSAGPDPQPDPAVAVCVPPVPDQRPAPDPAPGPGPCHQVSEPRTRKGHQRRRPTGA